MMQQRSKSSRLRSFENVIWFSLIVWMLSSLSDVFSPIMRIPPLLLLVLSVLLSLIRYLYLTVRVKGQIAKDAKFSWQERDLPSAAKRLLSLILASGEEQENIVGDLFEEYLQFNSKAEASVWLYKQVFMSALPLIYKSLRRTAITRFGARVNRHP